MTASQDDVKNRKLRYLTPGVSTYYQNPIVMDRGEGCYLFDTEGQRYLDFFAGILTVSVGHSNPKVNAALKHQLEKMIHVSTLYINEPMVDLAERLADLTPGDLEMSFFTSSGTEANETAIAMARIATGNYDVVALRHSYSGRSSLAMTLTGQSAWRIGLPGTPGVVHAKNPYYYRSRQDISLEEYLEDCLQDLEETIITSTSGKIAAVLAEPIQGVGGFITPPDGYFGEVARIARKYGGLFIADEVQTGFGRTGKWFGINHHGIVPDIMTFAKGMANGLPIGATITTREIGKQYVGPTISTFGGNPLTMRAALATLAVIDEENLVANAQMEGQRLRNGLEKLQERYPVIGDVRGKGLMQGMEFVRANKQPAADLVAEFFEETKQGGLLVGKGGLYGNAVRIAPPLTVSTEQVDTALTIMEQALLSVYAKHPELAELHSIK